MRVLHTSDWHLGRTFHRVDIAHAHAAFLDHLLRIVDDHAVDAVAIAGDLYDRAVPGPGSLAQFDDVAAGLVSRGVPVIVSSGNHDSFRRLGHGGRMLDAAGLHVRTRLRDIVRPVVLDDGRLTVYALPYLEPGLVHHRWGVARTHTAVLSHAMDLVRAHHAAHHPQAALLVLSHSFVQGSGEPATSESERDLDIGGLGVAPAGVFDGADYVALGHLHRPQRVTDTVRYSGSPVAFSFSEARSAKSLLLVDLGTHGEEVAVTPVPLDPYLPVATVTGTLDEVVTRAPEYRDHLVEVVLTDTDRPPRTRERLFAAYGRPYEDDGGPTGIVKYGWAHATPAAPAETRDARTLARRTETEVFSDFLVEVLGTGPTPGQRDRFDSALALARQEDA
ncbi:exonuclease SbcCD subunit D [Brevibacterium litoralis]|uniref:exonuclease SbcCD subunit D n=1 Tax=Brevibacterium litoralis TaxID=3138935 RepID=UPI0032EC5D51